MKFGLFGINFGPCANPATAAAVAQAAEAAGFESLWTGEHIVLPEPQVPPSPVPADTPFIDSAVALGFIAAHTRTVRLGTGIIILPQRNPVVLAKELASVDVLSNGRLTFGIGIGYLKPEFEAIGAPFDHKGPRSEEFLAAMIALWSMDKPEYRGRFVAFGGVNAMPRPVQKPHPEIVFGGHTKEAMAAPRDSPRDGSASPLTWKPPPSVSRDCARPAMIPDDASRTSKSASHRVARSIGTLPNASPTPASIG